MTTHLHHISPAATVWDAAAEIQRRGVKRLPVVDEQGHLWIFSNSHGTARPSYLHKSIKPYSIDEFELVWTTNFSLIPAQNTSGLVISISFSLS